MDLLKGLQKLSKTRSRVSVDFGLSRKILGIENGWEELIDVFLEVFDISGKSANESVVDETEISEEIVANENMLFRLEFLGDYLELASNLGRKCPCVASS